MAAARSNRWRARQANGDAAQAAPDDEDESAIAPEEGAAEDFDARPAGDGQDQADTDMGADQGDDADVDDDVDADMDAGMGQGYAAADVDADTDAEQGDFDADDSGTYEDEDQGEPGDGGVAGGGRQAATWQGEDGRRYCRRSDGTTGLVVGGGAGALIGRGIDGGRHRGTGTILGAIAGAVIGSAVERNANQQSCR